MMKKGDLNDYEHGMVVGTRQAGLSISETVDLQGFSRLTVSRDYKDTKYILYHQRKQPACGGSVSKNTC